jgi:hypothetical protein
MAYTKIMTVQNTNLRKSGPIIGNATNATFPFAFKVFSKTDIVVTYLNDVDTELVLTLSSDYSVTLNADQNVSPGGSVNMLWVPGIGTSITITSNVPNTQNLTLTNAGGFYPSAINDALDRIVIQIQQLAEQLSRTFKIAVSSIGTPGSYIGDYLNQAAASAASSALSAEASVSAAGLSESAATTALAAANLAALSAESAAVSALTSIAPAGAVVANFIDTSPLDIDPVTLSSIYVIGGWDMGSIVQSAPFKNESLATVRRVNLATDNSSPIDLGTIL